MMSQIWGGDVAAMRQLARDMDAAADAVRAIEPTLTPRITSGAWQGPDQQIFEGDWMSRLAPDLLKAADFLATQAEVLRANADAQEAASAATDETAGAITPIGAAPAAAPAPGAAGGPPVDVPDWWLTTDMATQTPDQIRERWDQLTDAQRQWLIEHDPMLYGNLDGIPLGWRSKANEINIQNEIDRLEAKIDQLNHENGFPPTSPSAALRRQSEIDALQGRIDEYKILLGTAPYNPDDPETWRTEYYDEKGNRVPVDDPRRAGWPKGSQVILFDPSVNGIATYHGVFTKDGDIPSGYDSVGMHVPGTGTTIEGWREGADRRGSQLHHDCNNSGLGSQAMIVYSSDVQPATVPQALAPDYAQTMGPKLAAFANTYVPDAPAFTVMGHSYGATIVTQAEALGMKADRVLYIAPAGYGEAPPDWPRETQTVQTQAGPYELKKERFLGLDDFPETSDTPHYVIISRADSVVGLIQRDPFNAHGDSPTYDPRVTRLETGWYNATDSTSGFVDEAPFFENHSSPFSYGSTAEQNMVQVFMGGVAEGWGGPKMYEQIAPWNETNIYDKSNLRPKGPEDWPDVRIQ